MDNSLPDQAELNRLANLAYYQILDSLPEQSYDDITQLAAHICHTPTSLITFVDQERQWFKSAFGFSYKQTSREVSFCAHAIQTSGQIMIVPDATQDERFSQNPLTTADPYISFYAGVPLVTEEGYALGTLCVIDTKPGELSVAQSSALSALARQVVDLLSLRKKTYQLEQARQELTKALAKERELQALKSKFVGMVSHQFRTPLTTIKTSLDLIKVYLQQLKPANLASFERHTRIIDGEISRFDALLTGVLTHNQIDSGKLTFRPERISVVDLCQELVSEHFAYRSDKRLVNLSIEGSPIWLELDRALMAHALLNLLANAFKFSSQNVVLTLCFEPAQLRMKVIDKGIGIPQQDMPYLFAPFFRASNSTLLAGTGLGLSIAREFIGMHGGTLDVESQERQGTTFMIRLPIY